MSGKLDKSEQPLLSLLFDAAATGITVDDAPFILNPAASNLCLRACSIALVSCRRTERSYLKSFPATAIAVLALALLLLLLLLSSGSLLFASLASETVRFSLICHKSYRMRDNVIKT